VLIFLINFGSGAIIVCMNMATLATFLSRTQAFRNFFYLTPTPSMITCSKHTINSSGYKNIIDIIYINIYDQ